MFRITNLLLLLAGLLFSFGFMPSTDELFLPGGIDEDSAYASSPSSQPLPASSSLPASIAASSATSQPEAASVQEPEPPQAELSLNLEFLQMIGKTNAELKEINGQGGHSYIMHGGTPVADYGTNDVKYNAAFWLSAEQEDMLNTWAEINVTEGNLPEENIWSDDYPVEYIEVWEKLIMPIFNTETPITYTKMEEVFGLAPETEFYAAGEMMDGFDFDTWICTYEIDGYSFQVTFVEENGEYVMFLVLISSVY